MSDWSSYVCSSDRGLAAGVQEIYAAVYAGHHAWSRKLMRYGNGSVVDSFDIMTREEFAETEFFRNFLAPWGIDRLVAVLLDRRGGERLGLMLPGPGDRDVERRKRGLRVLAPQMQRAARKSVGWGSGVPVSVGQGGRR